MINVFNMAQTFLKLDMNMGQVLIFQSFPRTSMETKETEKLLILYLLNNHVQHLLSTIISTVEIV